MDSSNSTQIDPNGIAALIPGASVSQPPGGTGRTLLDIIRDMLQGAVASQTGQTTRRQAQNLGLPQAEGLTPAQLQALMLMPERKAKTQEFQEQIQTAPMRRQLLQAQTKLDLAKAKFSTIDPHDLTPRALEDHIKEIDVQLGGMKGMIQKGVDPEYFKDLQDERDRFEKTFEQMTHVQKGNNVKKAQPDLGGQSSGSTSGKYVKIATGPGGKRMGYNTQTKKWEPIQ